MSEVRTEDIDNGQVNDLVKLHLVTAGPFVGQIMQLKKENVPLETIFRTIMSIEEDSLLAVLRAMPLEQCAQVIASRLAADLLVMTEAIEERIARDA